MKRTIFLLFALILAVGFVSCTDGNEAGYESTVASQETTSPVITAPETSAPVTSAPETSAPVTSVPETTAPVTTASGGVVLPKDEF